MRRPLALLLALVLLLQSGLVGSGVACLAGLVGEGSVGAEVAPPDGGGHHHGHHLATGQDGARDERGAGQAPHELAHCLAAACATPALAVTLAELPVPASVARQGEVAEPTAPHLPRVAPEPPPPRA